MTWMKLSKEDSLKASLNLLLLVDLILVGPSYLVRYCLSTIDNLDLGAFIGFQSCFKTSWAISFTVVIAVITKAITKSGLVTVKSFAKEGVFTNPLKLVLFVNLAVSLLWFSFTIFLKLW